MGLQKERKDYFKILGPAATPFQDSQLLIFTQND
jgi:hypothetical protein